MGCCLGVEAGRLGGLVAKPWAHDGRSVTQFLCTCSERVPLGLAEKVSEEVAPGQCHQVGGQGRARQLRHSSNCSCCTVRPFQT